MTLPSRAELDDILATTLEDRRLSRSERRALREVFADFDLDDDGRAFVRHRVFSLARETIRGHEAQMVLEWAEEVIKVLEAKEARDPAVAAVHFSPGDECRRKIAALLRQAQRSADICVFTITDDRLAESILETHRRGVEIRIISDDEKAYDRGSDIYRLGAEGVRFRVDRSEHHMHHKFAVFDRHTLLTGSYNWTRSAAEHNAENVLVTDDARLVAPYLRKFEQLWDDFGPAR